MIGPILLKPVFFGLLVAYLVGENALIMLPLVGAVFIGLSSARKAKVRVLLLLLAMVIGAVVGVFANSLTLSINSGIVLVVSLLASFITGVAMGMILRNYSWGGCLFITTSVMFIASLLLTSIYWDELRRDISITINARIAEIREMVNSSQNEEVAETSSVIDLLRYLDYYWEDFHLGLIFAQSLLVSLVLVGLLVTRLRIIPTEDGKNFWSNPNLGSFSRVRPPEHLVWLAILCALILIYDSHYGISEVIRLLARNCALGLSFVYWANGLSIMFHITELFNWNAMIMLLVVLFIFGFWSFPVLAIFGFFDTWWDFRNKLEEFYKRIKETKNITT